VDSRTGDPRPGDPRPDDPRPDEAEEALESTTLSTQPAVRLPGLGWLELLRWMWRQLTSMRTALFLLFLLALASVPGSVFPQRGSNPGDVTQYVTDHPGVAPWLDRLSAFDVYGSVWFSAIYLLLFVSLAGCVLPRSLVHARALRARPPAAPRNLGRLPEHRSYRTTAAPDVVLRSARQALRGRRWRVDATDVAVSAEKGYTRETGNLLFHLALLFLLVGVAVGALFGTHGSVLVTEGTGFANTLSRYDSFTAGSLADPEDIPPFSFTLQKFTATYERGGPQDGAPRSFEADVLVKDSPDATPRATTIKVNEPLVVAGTKVFLIGHGYAPHVTVRDGRGRVVLSSAVVFLPRDGKFMSDGAIKAPDARPSQLGFRGVFLPTAQLVPGVGGVSTYPAADNPELLLSGLSGNLGVDNGKSQSVYTIDSTGMKAFGISALKPGQTWVLPDKLGTITFDGVEQYASFTIAHDPGKDPVFFAAMAALLGLMLSLFVRRRRVWVRATAEADGRTLVEIGGLARTEAGGLTTEVDTLLGQLQLAAPDHEAAEISGHDRSAR
jgi:cytochrome c biogenesis protein